MPDFSDYGLRKSTVLSNDKTVLISIAAADDALAHAGLNKKEIEARSGKHSLERVDPDRTGVFVGSGLGCITSTLEN